MGKLVHIPKVDVPKVEIPKTDIRVDNFGGTTGWSGRRFTATEKGIDGTDDVMVIGPAFEEPKMSVVPDIQNNPAVRFSEEGAARNTEVYRRSSQSPSYDPALKNPGTMSSIFSAFGLEEPTIPETPRFSEPTEEVLELDESDLMICTPEDEMYYRAASSEELVSYPKPAPTDLSPRFDFTDVNPFEWSAQTGGVVAGTIEPHFEGHPIQGLFAQRWQGAEGPAVLVSEPVKDFSPVEEAWFVGDDALMTPPDPYFLAEATQILPRAKVIPEGNSHPISKAGQMLRRVWQAWVSVAGVHPFLFMGLQFLLARPSSRRIEMNDVQFSFYSQRRNALDRNPQVPQTVSFQGTVLDPSGGRRFVDEIVTRGRVASASIQVTTRAFWKEPVVDESTGRSLGNSVLYFQSSEKKRAGYEIFIGEANGVQILTSDRKLVEEIHARVAQKFIETGSWSQTMAWLYGSSPWAESDLI